MQCKEINEIKTNNKYLLNLTVRLENSEKHTIDNVFDYFCPLISKLSRNYSKIPDNINESLDIFNNYKITFKYHSFKFNNKIGTLTIIVNVEKGIKASLVSEIKRDVENFIVKLNSQNKLFTNEFKLLNIL